MPRKSLAAQSVASIDARNVVLPPPVGLGAAARKVWIAVTASLPRDHFRVSDAPLLKSYCDVTAQADRASAELTKRGPVLAGKVSPWLAVQEKSLRSQAMFALRLRLCPSARIQPISVGRQKQQAPVAPWDDDE